MADANRLLVVDDELMNRDMLSRRLERSGFKVETAEDAGRALEFLARQPFDLILLDSMMPGMTGIDLLRLLRAQYSADELPVIMVTALVESDKIIEAMNLGANDYVTKPIDFPVTVARIRSQLGRKAAETALRESEQRYALAARGSNDGLWDWDLKRNEMYYSARWKAMLGYNEADLNDRPEEWLDRVHPQDKGTLKGILDEHLADKDSRDPFECEHRILHKDGHYRWMLSRGLAVRDTNGSPVRVAGSLTDVTDKKVFDALTGLPNRLLFLDRLARSMERFRSEHSFMSAILFLDLDRFKLVNDSMGHAAGDQLLVGVAERLTSAIRGGSTAARNHIIARLGGDEFAILLDDVRNAENAMRVAERVLQQLKSPVTILGREVFCTASIGIALIDAAYEDASDWVRDADTAMYSAKSQGKSRCAVFDAEMRERVVARMQTEMDLQRALERNELVVYYQPKVRFDSQRICGFEALVRWNHPTRGVVAPVEFIWLAEENGLIIPLGMFVLREACRQMAEWQKLDPAFESLEISVNISVRQFRDPDLLTNIPKILAETGLRPNALQLEITESILLEDYEGAIETLKKLKALDVGLKIDDFGTGYSSLKYLCQLPFDTLKIDRSFTVDLASGNTNVEVVKTILNMAHNLGMDVVAEGVEKREEADCLQSMGCEFGQGYYFARPMQANAAKELLKTGKLP